MNGLLDADLSLRILENHRREDPLNVEMAIECACAALRREIADKARVEASGDPTYEHDEQLRDALREC